MADAQIGGRSGQAFLQDVQEAAKGMGEGSVFFARERTKYEQAVRIAAAFLAKKTVVPLCDDYGEARNRAIAAQFSTEKPPKGVAAVLFTSGTSGVPKGVMLTQRALAWNIRTIRRYMGERKRKIFIFRPLIHSAVSWHPFLRLFLCIAQHEECHQLVALCKRAHVSHFLCIAKDLSVPARSDAQFLRRKQHVFHTRADRLRVLDFVITFLPIQKDKNQTIRL